MVSKRGAIWVAVALSCALVGVVVLLSGSGEVAAQVPTGTNTLSAPAPASGVTLANGIFRFSIASSTFETGAVPDTGLTTDAARLRWTKRSLGGPKAAEFTFDVSKVAGDTTNGLVDNICQVEVQYSYNEGGDVWSDGSAWQVAAYRVWDGYGAVDSGGTAVHWATTGSYTGRRVHARMALPEDGSWAGENRDYRFRFRLVWGRGWNFNQYEGGNDRTAAFSHEARKTPEPVCQYYAQDDAWRGGQFGATMTLGVDDIVPAFQLGSRGALRTLGTADGARAVLVPGASIGYTGTDTATSTMMQWRYKSRCGTARAATCVEMPGEPEWRDARVVTAGREWKFAAAGGYWIFQYRLKTGYGGGRALDSVFPGVSGDLGVGGGANAPVYAGRIAPQNRTRWLNQEEYGVTTWYKLGDEEARVAAGTGSRWTGGEGQLLRGRADMRFAGPYGDWIRTRNFNFNIKQVTPDFSFPRVAWTNGEFQAWLGGDNFLDKDIVAVPSGNLRSGAQNQHWDMDPTLASSSPDYGAFRIRFAGVTNEAYIKEKYRNADERRLFLLMFERCRYQPGERWDRYAVQTQSAHDWRLFGQYACTGQPARDLENVDGVEIGNVTSYASAGLEVTRPRTYSLVVHEGNAGLYQGENAIEMIDNPAGGKLAFLTPGVYDILMQRAAGGFFDVELRQMEAGAAGGVSGRPRNVELVQDRRGETSYSWGAQWDAVNGAIGYAVEYSYLAGGKNYTYTAMTVGPQWEFETPLDTDEVWVRVAGIVGRSGSWGNIAEYLERIGIGVSDAAGGAGDVVAAGGSSGADGYYRGGYRGLVRCRGAGGGWGGCGVAGDAGDPVFNRGGGSVCGGGGRDGRWGGGYNGGNCGGGDGVVGAGSDILFSASAGSLRAGDSADHRRGAGSLADV